jgi:CubicO group peptidase (beta-lactamase class C family)
MQLRHGTPQEAGMLPERIERARQLCARWVEEDHTPSLCACVARRGVIVLDEAWGVLGPEPDAGPLTTDAIFPIASLTKPITTTLVMQLVEAGVLGLNRPAIDYLPELKGEGVGDILVHHLLTHTAGYGFFLQHHVDKKRNDRSFELPPCPPWRHPNVHEMLSMLWDAPLDTAPGQVMNYANHHYALLGDIITRLTEQPLEDLAQERVFAPLGMSSSSYVVPQSFADRVVRRPKDFPLAQPIDLFPGFETQRMRDTPNAGGGVYSTARDITVFGQMILNRGRYGDSRILSPASVAAMTRDQVPGTKALLLNVVAERASWGYGFAVESPSKWRYFHGSLAPLGTLRHPGAGGVGFWIDRANDVVGVYFEVTKRVTERYEQIWNFDLFENAITAAVEE